MVDRRFFYNAGSLTLGDIASLTGTSIASDGSRIFTGVAPLECAGTDDISFLDNVKYLDAFAQSKAGACFVRPKYVPRAPKSMVLLITDDPYSAYALTAQRFYPEPAVTAGIAPQAVIAKSAVVGKGARIDPGAVIGEHVRIGSGCWIGANTVIDDNVEIGDNCRIGALCTISHAIMGKRVLLHRGIHIGQDGFGVAPGPKTIIKVPQLGRVLIGDDVEIGAGTCIDRGAGPDTIIGDGCKIDNLVQIGHNVQLGKYVIIAAQCGISGSTRIDDGAMIGGQVGIAGHLHIGAGAKLAACSGVMTDIPPGATYGGAPAVPIKDWHRQTVTLAKLAKTKEE